MNETARNSAIPPAWAASFLPAADRVLYPLTLGITAVAWGFQLFEFIQGGAWRPRHPFAEGYLAVLTSYAAARESSKWLGVEASSVLLRRGELFVALWVSTWLAMTAVANLHPRFVMPQELNTILFGVLGVFVVSGVSSGARQRSAGRRGDSTLKARVLEILKTRGDVSAQQVADELDASRTAAWRALESLVKEGAAEQDESPNSRDRRYRLPK